MINSFISNFSCSYKEKVEIQVNYWLFIFQKGIDNLIKHNQQVPDVLIAASAKWVKS